MYLIECDGQVLYSPRFIGAEHALASATMTRGVNKAGSLEFEMPFGNKMYSSINLLKSDIVVSQDGKILLKCRPLDITTDFNRNKTIMCEGPLAFLNDGLVRPYDHSTGIKIEDFFKEILNNYAASASSNRKVYPGTFTHSDKDTKLYIKRDDYSNSLTELQDTLLNEIGGYLVTRYADDGKTYIDYFEEITKSSGQSIEFSKNLLDLENYIDASAVFTTIVPLGKSTDGTRLTIASVNSGRDYIEDTTARSRYGHIVRSVVWQDIDDAATLKKLGQATLNNAIKMALTLTVNAFDLHLLNVNTAAFEYGTIVLVTSIPHGLVNEPVLLSDEDIDLMNPDSSEYTLGIEGNTISSAAAKPDKKK